MVNVCFAPFFKRQFYPPFANYNQILYYFILTFALSYLSLN